MLQTQQLIGPPPSSCAPNLDTFPLWRLHPAEESRSETPAEEHNTEATMRSSVSFYLYFLLCVFLGVACMVGVCVWNTQWHGGFAWDTSDRAVLYRVPLTWGGDKRPWKLAHAGLMLLALLLSIVGLCAVFQVHNAEHIPALYSIHSWPLHVWLGASILTLSIAACISGINEKLIFSLKGTTNGTQPYKSLPPEAVFANSLAVVIVVFGLVVLRILANRNWERPEPGSQEAVYRNDGRSEI
ncbi:hypothetical protein CRUP_012110 [Coryphaenoides rupestris]|nr:hypothetical protein CRUP_012110 [Coryphaenoides rupestris]